MKGKLLKRRKPNRSLGGDTALLLFLIPVSIFMVLPLVYAISNAFKPMHEIFLFPPRFFVMNPTLDNFVDLFILLANSWVPFSRNLFNTLFITAAATAGHIIAASMAAYVLAKHKFPGRELIFNTVVLALMFSTYVTGIPNYITMAKLGWVDTYLAVIIPAIGYPLGLFLMKQFMEQIPDSTLESARIDGAREINTFWRIVMPSVKPAWLTLLVLSVQTLWNTQGGIFIYSEQLKTLSYALQQVLLGGIARAGVGAAITVFMMSVPIIIFIVTQSNIIETMTSSGLKE